LYSSRSTIAIAKQASKQSKASFSFIKDLNPMLAPPWELEPTHFHYSKSPQYKIDTPYDPLFLNGGKIAMVLGYLLILAQNEH